MAITKQPTAEELERMLASTSQIAEATGLHRQTVRKYFNREGLVPEVEEPKRKLYRFWPAVRCLLHSHDSETAQDRLNLAQARKAEAQTAILERNYIRREEIAPVLDLFFSGQNEIIRNSNLEEGEKERIFKKARDLTEKLENIA